MNNGLLPGNGLRLLHQAKPREFRLAVKSLPLLERLQTALLLAQENAKTGAAGRLQEKIEKALRENKAKPDCGPCSMSWVEKLAQTHELEGSLKQVMGTMILAGLTDEYVKKIEIKFVELRLLEGERLEALLLAKAFGLSDIAKKLGKVEIRSMVLADSKEEIRIFALACGITESELSEIALNAALERIGYGKPRQAQSIAQAYFPHNGPLQKE